MNKIIFTALSALMVSGCTTNPNSPFANTDLILQFRYAEGAAAPALYARKNSPGLENCSPKINTQYGYSLWGTHCTFQPKDIPEKVVIEYARFMSSKESVKRFYGHHEFADNEYGVLYYSPEGKVYNGEYGGRTAYVSSGKQRQAKAIAQLTPSAWHTFTFYPKQLLKKYQGVTPEYGSAITSGFAKKLVYTLSMQPDSTIKTEETYSYEYSGEGWRN